MYFERATSSAPDWQQRAGTLPRQIFCHRDDWLSFLSRSQNGKAIRALLRSEDNEVVGAFAGMIVRKFGVRILGSPFPGWTTPYMGLNLASGIANRDAILALLKFAFTDLACAHLEMMDRNLLLSDLDGIAFDYRPFLTYEVDIGRDPDALLGSFSRACRWNIRKAAKNGLVVEEAQDSQFADDFYDQLINVFARQRLVPPYPRERVHQLIASLAPSGMLMRLRALTPDGACAATGIFHPVDCERVYGWGFASMRHLQDLHPNELLLFEAMQRWRARGFSIMDLAGAGDYKKKYHPREVIVPWIRVSKYAVLSRLREIARKSILWERQLIGGLRTLYQRQLEPYRH